MSSPITQASLIGGELAVSLQGRTDLVRYGQAADIIENFIVDPHGGASNRQGSKFIAYTKLQDGSQVRLIPFEPSADESYILEFGHEYLRIHTQYGPVFTDDFHVILGNDGFDSAIPFDEPPAIPFDQRLQAQGFTTPPGVPPGPTLVQRVSVRIASFGFGVAPQLRCAIYTSTAGHPNVAVLNADFTDFIAPDPTTFPVPNGFITFDLPAPVSLAPNTLYHVVIQSDSGDNVAQMCVTSEVLFSHDSYTGGKAQYFRAAAWHDMDEFAPYPGTMDWAFTVNGPASSLLDMPTPYQSLPMDDLGTESELTQLVYTQSVDVMTICHKNHPAYELKRYGEGSWTFAPIQVQTSNLAPDSLSFASIDGGHLPVTAPTKKWEYAVAGVSREGEESEPILSGEQNVGVMTDTDFVKLVIFGTQPVDHYSVYKGRGGTYGFIGISKMRQDLTEVWDATYAQTFEIRYAYWQDIYKASHPHSSRNRPTDARDDSKTTFDLADADARAAADAAVAALTLGSTSYVFSDENYAPDYTDQPRRFINPFNVDGGRKPAVTTYFQQRQVFANWQQKVDTIAMSEVGDYKNFQRSIPTLDDDSIEATLAAGQLNSIKALVAMRQLFLFTSGAEFVMSSSQQGPIAPSNIDSLPVSRRGSGTLQPLVIGNVILFVDRAGRIREWLYQQDSNDYPATDVGLLAAHLFDDQYIVAWSYVAAPRSVVWAVRTDGVLLTFTYVREQTVAAWTHHTTQGKLRSLCHIREFGERGDTPWVVAVRTLNGVEKTLIEKFPPRHPATSPFLDCHAVAEYVEDDVLMLSLTAPLTAPGGIQDGVIVGTMGWDKTNWVKASNPNLVVQDYDVDAGNVGISFTADGVTYKGRIVLLDDPGHIGFSTSYWVELLQDVPDDLTGSPPLSFASWQFLSKVWGGFDHLIGETVSVVGDESVLPPVVVAGDGTITLGVMVAKLAAGLPYVGTIKLLPLNAAGSEIRSKQKIVSSIDIDVQDTRGIWVGEKETSLVEKKPDYPDNVARKTARITVRTSNTWSKSGAQIIKQIDPIPCTILSFSPEVTLGG